MSAGAEVPFEIELAGRGRGPALYCYRSLTEAFIEARLALLRALTSYAPAAGALAALPGLGAYLELRGVVPVPAEGRERADAALQAVLELVFAERDEFGFDAERFAAAYGELEASVYEGRSVTVVLAPLLGLALDPDTEELPLGDGLSLVAGDAYPEVPAEAVWGGAGGETAAEPNVLAVLSVDHARTGAPPLSLARRRFRRLLTTLRLFAPGGYALGPLGHARTDRGPWRTAPLEGSGRPRLVTLLHREQEDELRAFGNLVLRRVPGQGGLAWALGRYEMGCERLAPFEALSDWLLALRALLEPEGPQSGRLAQRLALLCANPADRAALAVRTARASELERTIMTGLGAPPAGADGLAVELGEHLRALLRDVLCGHLDADLCAVADELLAGEATPVPAAAD